MASYSPAITINTSPTVQVTMAGALTYDEFVNSLGQFCYWIKGFRIQSSTYQQLQQPISYIINDANGQQLNQAIIPLADPYQFTTALKVDAKEFGIVLNGQSSLSLLLLPNEFIVLALDTEQVSNQDGLDSISPGNFKRADDLLGNLSLYKKYLDSLD